MDSINLAGKLRHKSGRGSCNILRNQHKIPGVLYGRENQNLMVEFSEMELGDVIRSYGENALVNLDLDGTKIKAIIKEVQRDPVKRNLTHIDMKYIKDDERVHADIPIVIRGEEYVRSNGGIVQKQMSTISVEAKPDKLPKYIIADISKLRPGDRFTVADMELSSDLTIDTDIKSIVIAINTKKEMETLADTQVEEIRDSSPTEKSENI